MVHNFRALVLCVTALCVAPYAKGDSVTVTGALSSDQTAVASGDPVITNPSTINIGDPFTIVLNYDPASFSHVGSTYTLTDASLTLDFDSYSFGYSTVAGNYLAISTPGAFGPGTVSFQFCSSLAGCSTSDYLNLYFSGTVTDLASLASQAGGLSGDPSASPSEFEFLRNFADGSQTDLQGTISSVTGASGNAVPEPSTLAFCAAGFIGVLVRRTYRQLQFRSHKESQS